jgi:hypothetical protein
MEFKNQKEMFNWIWENRPHVSELTGEPLIENRNHFQWHWQFLHVLGKQAYPSYKLREENIILALPEEHEKQEVFLKFLERQQELRQKYYAEFYNKEFPRSK